MTKPGPTLLLLSLLCWALSTNLCAEVAVGPGPAALSTYAAHGRLQSVDLAHGQATIAHDAIASYMPSMTMSFAVPDAAILAALKPGDELTFRLCVSGESAWIDQIVSVAQNASQPAFAPAVPSHELAIGDSLPDIALVDQDGHARHLHDFRGQAVAITFIYARCPLPTYCPLLNRNFRAAQTLLGRLGAGENWHFLSVSMDAAHDAPGDLAHLALSYEADARHWSFVSAPEAEVRQLGQAVGLEFSLNGGQISHNLRTVVLDGTGRIRQIYRGNSWTPQDLAAEVKAVLPRPTVPPPA